MERINLGKSAPELYRTVAELDRLAGEKIKQANIAEGFSHLLKLRASQINQCSFCIRMHSQDASKSGESLERITLLNAWRESEYFNEKEQSALELIEEITLISKHQLSQSVYEKAAKVLSNEEISAIEWLAIVINAWNRIAISSRYQVKPV